MTFSNASPLLHRQTLICALAATDPATLADWLEVHEFTSDDARWLQEQGLAVYAVHKLQRSDLLSRLPTDAVTALHDRYHQGVTTSAAQDWEIERVLQTLAEAGVAYTWVKGGMLAYTVYTNPADRQRGDLDLWILPEQLAQAQTLVEGLGYTLHTKEHRPPALAQIVGTELQMVNYFANLHLIELQSPVIRGEWIRRTTAVDHAGIWQRRVPAPLDGHVYPSMAPEDTLIYLCIHQAVSHQFSAPWLRNLLDVHQVVGKYDLDWTAIGARASAWQVATVVWTVLDLARRLLNTAVPEPAMQQLSPSARRRRLIGWLDLDRALLELRHGGYQPRRFLIQLLLVDRWQDAARLLLRGAYPEAAWLRARYDLTPDQSVWRWRLVHLWLLATTTKT